MLVYVSKPIKFLYRGVLTKDVPFCIGTGFMKTTHIAKAGESVRVIEEIGDKVYVNLYDSFSYRINKLLPKSILKV